jgi:hypothetical protein
MDNSQYINNVTSQINPGSSGVNFTQLNSSVIIPFPPQISPIVTEVSIPNTNTNVIQITVVITTPNGTVIVKQTSSSDTNTVDEFPLQPLPENSTLTITFQTDNGQPPQNVTISVIACYTPSTATTIVTSGSVPPAITGSTPTLTISSTTSGATQGTGETLFKIEIYNVVPCKDFELTFIKLFFM